jgi:hypothetical protein
MSREWYIRTDKRHIEKTAYTPSPSPSKQEVFRKNRGKYVAYAIFGVFAVRMLTGPSIGTVCLPFTELVSWNGLNRPGNSCGITGRITLIPLL